ncbi:hypothetical protein GCM10011529_07120 [Polymorphobacter glacialis]|uniref:EF-hand domain-containing protein n=1 Tax=Sandarakinorhabdus glacialis TaxID=1614636 RepID=A0A916ZMP1_9SPHN|nr:hypothetical protein [Polymorphobacter glacialis]GGE03248.1 hypothetical protein GCM10011529_07120 [Polymorphobacter glacialis]
MIDQTFTALDASKDGFVSQAEVTALKQKALRSYDRAMSRK